MLIKIRYIQAPSRSCSHSFKRYELLMSLRMVINWTQSTDNSRLVMCPIDSYFRVKIHNRVTTNRKRYCDIRQQCEFFRPLKRGQWARLLRRKENFTDFFFLFFRLSPTQH